MIRVRDLNVYYGTKQALFDINMDIEARSVTALIGPSGCGKSTFLRTFNRMNDFIRDVRVDGEIAVNGVNIYSDMIDVDMLRKTVGMVFQAPNPFPKSIYENVAYGPRIHGVKSKATLNNIVEKSLRDVGLWDEVKDRLDALATGLSGGQQQRLCIARTLAVNPDIVLMDEPTSALDPISTTTIEELAQQLKERYTIVIVTHNMQQAARISDKTAFFLNGSLIEYANTDTLFSNPKHHQTEDYISGRFG